MAKKKKDAARTAVTLARNDAKVTKITKIGIIRQLFLTGKRFTAKQLNKRSGGNDARKTISDLRKEGWKIESCRVIGNTKVYWLAELPIDKGRGIVWKWNK